MDKPNNFNSLFFRNEYRELAGPNHKVTLLLGSLLLLTFCALGFALGGYEELQTRMSNPFTRWVDLHMGGFDRENKPKLETFLRKTIEEGKHNLNYRIEWERYFVTFRNREYNPVRDNPKEAGYFTGRTIEANDDLFHAIMSDDNVLCRNDDYLSEGNCGVIATTDMMEKLGYDPSEYQSVKHLNLGVDGANRQTFVKLYAVVKDVPSRCDFLSFPQLYNAVQGDYDELILRNTDTLNRGRYFLLSETADQTSVLREGLAGHFQLSPYGFNIKEILLPVDVEKEYTLYDINFPAEVKSSAASKWIVQVSEGEAFADYTFIECSQDAAEIDRSDHQSLVFNDLNGLIDFQADLKEQAQVTLPMEDINNRENFRRVANLTSFLSTTLFLFGLLSIVLYLVNLLNNHVDHIRPHLGTFKAMGLPNGQLLNVYTKIALRLLLTATALSLPLAWVVGKMADRYLLQVGFRLWHYAIPLAIILILVVACLLVRRRLRAVFETTPGDLIYERD